MDCKEEEKKTEEKPMSKRELYRKRFTEKYPDDNFDDEETRYGRIMADAEANDKYAESNRKMNDLVEKYPAYGGMWTDAINGETFITSFVSRHGRDSLLAALEDPEMAKELSDAEEKYYKQKKEDEEYERKSGENITQSISNFIAFCDGKNLDTEKANAVFGKCVEMAIDGANGIFTTDMYETALKAMNYDNDVQTAREEGEVQGRNANIEAKLAKKADMGGGKVPPAFGGGTGTPEKKPAKQGMVRNPLNGEMVEVDNDWRKNGFKS